jgi:probable HAF family extracellular repeat protein
VTTYQFTELGQNTGASGINDAGLVIGGRPGSAFLYDKGVYTTLSDPSGQSTSLAGINSEGEIVGSYTDNGGHSHGFTYNNGSYTTFDYPSASGNHVPIPRPCCVEENKMSYHIEINEYQRRLIMKALTSTDVNQFSQAPGSGDAFDTEAKEFVCLVQMFGTLDLDDTAPGAEALCRVQM